MLEFVQIAKKYNSMHLMTVIATMQLLPRNHGKNVRIEEIARIAAANLNAHIETAPLSELQSVIGKEFPFSENEDRPMNLFTENIMFFGGNHIVLPGVIEDGSDILNNLLRAIFFTDNQDELAQTFTDNIYSATKLLLHLSNSICESAGLKRYITEEPQGKSLEFPTYDKIEEQRGYIVISDIDIINHCKTLQIQESIIERFVLDSNDPLLLEKYPIDSPLCTKPFVKIGNDFVLLQPISIVESLIRFIWQEAETHSCFSLVRARYNRLLWLELPHILYSSQWLPIEFELPGIPAVSHCSEAIFSFDLNKLGYVCFIESGFLPIPEPTERFKKNAYEEVHHYGEFLRDRQNAVLSKLYEKYSPVDYEFLTLYVVSNVGFPQQFSFPVSSMDQLNLWFGFTDLKSLIYSEESDPLLLWKFAKSYAEVTEQCELVSLDGMLDVFTMYKMNDYSLWPVDEEMPATIALIPGQAQSHVYNAIQRRDEHLAPINLNGISAYIPVYNYCPYAPFYMRCGDKVPGSILLEDFVFPVWLENDQSATHSASLISGQLEMLAFWLQKLSNHVSDLFDKEQHGKHASVIIKLDEKLSGDVRPKDIINLPLLDIAIPIAVTDDNIILSIPCELMHWYNKPNNEAEKYIVQKLLNALIVFQKGKENFQRVEQIVDLVIGDSGIKMANILANANTIQLETRNAPPYRPTQQYDLSHIRYNLSRAFGLHITADHLSTKDKRQKTAFAIATQLFKRLNERLAEYDQNELLVMLMNCNEACVQNRAARALDIPVKINAFSSQSYEAAKMMLEEQHRVKSALAVRCIIELIVARDNDNARKPANFAVIDELIALMQELIEWASLSDGIKMELYDPEMKLLKCGRIYVDFVSVNKALVPWAITRSEIEVNDFSSRYEDLFNVSYNAKEDDGWPDEIKEMENAFKSDWGIGLIRLQEFIIDLSNFLRRTNHSLIAIEESRLYETFCNAEFEWVQSEMSSALNVLTLMKGWDVDSAPQGYDKKETYPWRYNRQLSYIRRPIARLTFENETFYYWTARHLWAAYDNILSLLFDGMLAVHGAKEIEKIVAKIHNEKGDNFRNKVKDWLKENSDFDIFDYEILIRPGAKLNADKDYGDIDILMIDHSSRIIYSIECKNSTDSRSVSEMKTELDKYLSDKGWIEKHCRRHDWLIKNQSSLNTYVNNAELYAIHSIMVTAYEIPISYLKKMNITLPFISFPKLKMSGIAVLNTLAFS